MTGRATPRPGLPGHRISPSLANYEFFQNFRGTKTGRFYAQQNPCAGSDSASLSTRAFHAGGHFVINSRKISDAMGCGYILAVAHTALNMTENPLNQ